MQERKLAISFPSDTSGQGQVRNFLPFGVLNQIPDYPVVIQWSHKYTGDPSLLEHAQVLYFQRACKPDQLEIIKWYKENQKVFGYTMILDHDDLIWGKNETYEGGNALVGVPSYNPSHPVFSQDIIQASSIEIMKMMDKILVSTEVIKNFLITILGITVPITVVPNTVSCGYFGNSLNLRSADIKKPKVIYTGAQGHYSNDKKMLGDWSEEWRWWVIREVNKGNIDFVCMGGLPWFLESIRSKIRVYEWMPVYNLALTIRKEAPHYCINPLKENMFNSAKSDLKMVESAATGMICVGSVFNQLVSPYDNAVIKIPQDATQDDISNAIYCYNNKDKHNEALVSQYKWLNSEGRYTESGINIERLTDALLG